MSNSTSNPTSTSSTGSPGDAVSERTESRRDQRGTGTDLVGQDGRTTIADVVVSKIAGMAARDVNGVHALGGGASRAFGALRERIPGASSSVSQGVSVEVGERQAAVDVDLVVEYGVSVPDLADSVRRNIITSLERMTGLDVIEVNITVDDIYLPGQDDDAEARQGQERSKSSEPRVQ